MSQPVRFIRKGGRIIPIHGGSQHPQHREKGHAKTLVGTGVATGVAAGYASAKFHIQAAHLENASLHADVAERNAISAKKFKVAQNYANISQKNLREANMHFNTGKRLQKAGSAVGGALIGAGVHRSLKNSDLTESQKAAVATTSGLGATFALRTVYTKSIGRTKLWDAVKHAAKRVSLRGFKV